MSITYAQKNKNVVQTKRESSVSIIDTSSQSESLQRKADMANNAAQRAEAPRPNNTGMPDNLKAGIESLSGFSMDDVRVHYNSSMPATVQALAYTQGTDIHVAPGQEKCLPHEAWHVAQQMAGRVSPTVNINGMPVNDNAALEHEADVMGEKAVMQKKENIKIKSKIAHGDALQLEPNGDNDVVCAADILYKDPEFNLKHVKGVGFNDSGNKRDVLGTFTKYGLDQLANVKKKGTGNEPGQCAEPHAVANALGKITLDESDEFGNLFNRFDFLDIYVSETVVRKRNGNFFTQTDSNHVNTLSRCETCAQWIGSDGHVYKNYLNKGVETRLDEQNRAYSEEMQIRLEKYKKEFDEQGKMKFGISEHNNVDFFNHEIKLPEWFKKDDNIKSINNQSGLRTIIKKQLLKNRVVEICKKADKPALDHNILDDYPACVYTTNFPPDFGERFELWKNAKLKQENLENWATYLNNEINQIRQAGMSLTEEETNELQRVKRSVKQKKKFVKDQRDYLSQNLKKVSEKIKRDQTALNKENGLIDKIAEDEKKERYLKRLAYYRNLMGIPGEITGLTEDEVNAL